MPQIQMGSAERCPSCGAEMRPDQRYCVECGTRRGQPRFSLDPRPAPETGAPVAVATAGPGVVRRISSGATLLSGLAVLLLALGVGVLIGKGNTGAAASGKPVSVVLRTGGGTGATAAAGGTASSASGSQRTSGAGRSKGGSKSSGGGTSGTASINGKAGPSVNVSKLHTKAQRVAAVKKLTNTKVQLNNGQSLAPANQSMGGACNNNTAGCQNGKFTGTFFGGG